MESLTFSGRKFDFTIPEATRGIDSHPSTLARLNPAGLFLLVCDRNRWAP